MATTPTPTPDVVTIVWNRPAQNQLVTVTVPTAIIQLLDWLAANEPNQQGQKYVNAPNVLWSDVFALLIPRWMSLYQQGQLAAAQATVASTMAGIQGSLVQVTVAGMPGPPAPPPVTYSISGALGANAAGAVVALSGSATATQVADQSGNFLFSALPNGSYIVTPTKAPLTFTPVNAAVTINGANVSGVNFTGA